MKLLIAILVGKINPFLEALVSEGKKKKKEIVPNVVDFYTFSSSKESLKIDATNVGPFPSFDLLISILSGPLW